MRGGRLLGAPKPPVPVLPASSSAKSHKMINHHNILSHSELNNFSRFPLFKLTIWSRLKTAASPIQLYRIVSITRFLNEVLVHDLIVNWLICLSPLNFLRELNGGEDTPEASPD